MTERYRLKSIVKIVFMLFVPSILMAETPFAADGLDRMRIMWLEAKFDFGLLSIIFFAIGGMFIGSRVARRNKDKNRPGRD